MAILSRHLYMPPVLANSFQEMSCHFERALKKLGWLSEFWVFICEVYVVVKRRHQTRGGERNGYKRVG